MQILLFHVNKLVLNSDAVFDSLVSVLRLFQSFAPIHIKGFIPYLVVLISSWLYDSELPSAQ